MSVTEVRQALGQWSLSLRDDTPADVLDAITPFGHVAVLPGRLPGGDILAAGDNLLTAARYVGVYRSRDSGGADGRTTLRGAGMALWLGDEDGKGYVYETSTTASGTFSATVTQLLAPVLSVQAGTLTAVPGDGGGFSGSFIYQSPREALTYVTDTFSSDTVPVGWRINGDGRVDAGPENALYQTTPSAMLVSKDETAGRDLGVIGMRGSMLLENDLTDYTTRVLLLAEGEEGATASGSASLPSTPYRDIRGNFVKFTRLISESDTSGANALVRATLQLNRFSSPRYAVTLDTEAYDVKGDFGVGDTIMLFDPGAGFSDPAREVYYRGLVLNPMWVQVTEMTWPVPPDWTVAYRDGNGVWTDLSPYYVPEGGATTIVVGRFGRDILASSYEQVGSRPIPDSSIPAAPTFSASATSAYVSDLAGSSDTKAVVQLTWNTPLNTNGSTVVDGHHYELRYRPVNLNPYPATHLQMSSHDHDDLLTHEQPLIPAIVDVSWQTIYVPWGTNVGSANELTPGVLYEFQVAAVDSATPPNSSAFSASWTVPAALDNLAPSQPAAPEVAGSQVAIQVKHLLGTNAGGTFNLEPDLDHLEIHVSGDPAFTPDADTYVGKLQASVAQLQGGIPVIGTFTIPQVDGVQVKVIAVDRTGNRSAASPAAAVSVVLIDNAHISDLSVTKVTAGFLQAGWIITGSIWSAVSGARAGFDNTGFYTYDGAGVNTFRADTLGNVSIVGEMTTAAGGRRIRINPAGGEGQIRFYSSDNADYSLIDTTSYYGGSESGIRIRSSVDANNDFFGALFASGQVRMGYLSENYSASGGLFYADNNQTIVGNLPGNRLVAGSQAFNTNYWSGVWDGASVHKAGLRTYDSGGTSIANFGTWDDAGSSLLAGISTREDRYVTFKGSLYDGAVILYDNDDLFMGGAVAGLGGASFTVSIVYGPTMLNAPRPFYYLLNGTSSLATDMTHKVTSYSTTGFTVRKGNNTDAVQIGWLATQIN